MLLILKYTEYSTAMEIKSEKILNINEFLFLHSFWNEGTLIKWVATLPSYIVVIADLGQIHSCIMYIFFLKKLSSDKKIIKRVVKLSGQLPIQFHNTACWQGEHAKMP